MRRTWILAVITMTAIASGGCTASAAPATSVAPASRALAAPSSVATPGPSVKATAAPTTDGEGAEHFTGTWTFIGNEATTTPGHDTIGLFSVEATDPRTKTDGRFDAGLRMYREAGPTWGTVTLVNPHGQWRGPCSGGNWMFAGNYSVALACWLEGSGGPEYDGYSMYLQMLGGGDVPMRVDGIIYPGAIPTPEPTPAAS